MTNSLIENLKDEYENVCICIYDIYEIIDIFVREDKEGNRPKIREQFAFLKILNKEVSKFKISDIENEMK